MAPDLNSLPPSSPTSNPRAMIHSGFTSEPLPMTSSAAPAPPRGDSPTGSPRSASISLQAAATMNAGLQHESTRSPSSSFSLRRQSPVSGRRRSTVLMNLQLNDPSVPSPGEMLSSEHSTHQTASPLPISSSPQLMTADPHHHRTPSLGELHQELEAEQEAQVNRLLQMIRQQQLQLQQLQSQQSQAHGSAVAEDSAIVPERAGTGGSQPASQHGSAPQSAHPAPHHVHSGSFSRSPGFPHHPRSSFDMARADLHRRSRTPSRGASPRLRATSISGESDQFGGSGLAGRDESAFYQAETQMLTRENQMLRHRIRDLEKQLSEMSTSGTASPIMHVPSNHSHLQSAESADDSGADDRNATPSNVTGLGVRTVDPIKEV